MAGLVVLILLYAIVLFSEFLAPYALFERAKGLEQHPPMRVRFIDLDGTFHLRPFVYGMQGTLDLSTFVKTWTPVEDQRYPISLFVRGGPEYKLLGLLPIKSGVRLFGVKDGYIFLFGSDQWGRDMFSRVLYGGRISMTIGWAGVLISLILGVIIGVASGYFSGTFDFAVQRVIEVLMSVPSLPLWLILSASVPREWTPIQVYFALVVILSLLGWTSLARTVRGMVLAHRESQFILAARNIGASSARILILHLIPSITSYLVVTVTLAVPGMILAETSLSFLGLGIRPPMTSWGALLREAQNVNYIVLNPWYLIPAIFVIVAVLAYNFVGDGVRDAADPFSHR
jgi:peptide/nickel transport system permease protein